MIFNTRNLVISVILFFVFYVFLTWFLPTTGLDRSYYKSFIKIHQSLYGDYGNHGLVEFLEAKSNTSTYQRHPFKKYDDDVLIKMMNEQQIEVAKADAMKRGLRSVNVGHAEFYINTWQYAMIPMIFLMALILATPMHWKSPKAWGKKGLMMLVGLVLFNLFILFRFWIRFVTEINRHGWLEVGSLGSTGKYIFTHFNTFLMFMGVTLTVGIVIWGLVTFPFTDKKLIFENYRE